MLTACSVYHQYCAIYKYALSRKLQYSSAVPGTRPFIQDRAIFPLILLTGSIVTRNMYFFVLNSQVQFLSVRTVGRS